MQTILYTNGLEKCFRLKDVTVPAVQGVQLQVGQGEIYGFLGPNGAGKTTTLRMLTTLLTPDAGEAMIAGYDLRRQPRQVRSQIGYVGQAGGSDRDSSAWEDLLLQGQLYGMSKSAARDRAKVLIEALDLGAIADRRCGTYSGGQRRRLDIALGMMHTPKILFLDEPTTGLDPQNRERLWEEVRKLRDTGVTIFLTTHYMDEADALADRIGIMDQGRIVAEETPRALKQQVAGDVVVLGLQQGDEIRERASILLSAQSYVREITIAEEQLRLYVNEGEYVLPDILRLLDQAGITLRTISLSQPTLNDVFLRRTGRRLAEETFA